jgi:enterochelin esterase-like enzyme
MKKTVLLFLIGSLLVCSSSAQDDLRIMESLIMPSRILKQDIHFSICLPKSYYDDNKSYPVVYLLHGLGDDEASWLEYGRISQFADQAVDDGETVPIIFVMPEGFRNYYVNDYKGSFLYQDMFVMELVPYIDTLFRTLPDRRHRALMGYSMGGFGALTLHLKYADLFGSTVPLSISIRTDEQYMSEDASEWDQQWGLLFGSQGQTGTARITEYYKENCPFYQLQRMSPAEIRKLKIYIDNGDKEQTLCRSNEELHILMRSLDIPHEFRVREGDHSFGYWCSALPNALRFISDAFESKPYRGDIVPSIPARPISDRQLPTLTINNEQIFAFVPSEYDQTSRLYPAIYLAGKFSPFQRKTIAASVNQEIENNTIGPLILVFLQEDDIPGLTGTIPLIEEKLRIRKGYRFRATLAYQAGELPVFTKAVNDLQFTSMILADGYLPKDGFSGFLSGISPEALKRISFYIDAPDKGNFNKGNGNAHMLLRDKEIQHKYRVREGDGGFEWFLTGLPAMITFTANRFHK